MRWLKHRPIQIELEPNNYVQMLLSDYNDASSYCLRFIDPYGDTVFNELQIPILIDELSIAINKLTDHEIVGFANEVINLVKKAQNKVHTYIKFYGD